MKTQHIEKINYCAPIIECIPLDNEISLALESNPPIGPDEGFIRNPDNKTQDPFRSNDC